MIESDTAHGTIILTGAYDDHYLAIRRDNPHICTSAGKRLLLYRAISEASGIAPILLSPQPRGREKAMGLPAVETKFGTSAQHFSRSCSIRKIRVLFDMFYYARHVARHMPKDSILILDNFELIYVVAIYYCRFLGKQPKVVLEFEDGKHLIDHGIFRLLSAVAERLAKPLLRGAILATPALGNRLPPSIPKETIPGILKDDRHTNPLPGPIESLKFLFSGSLDFERGAPLLLDYLESSTPADNCEFHITGQGHFLDRLANLQKKNPGRIYFHGCVSQHALEAIRRRCHFGLNLQCSAHPVSAVTYPSKTFDYLNAGLRVISTRAAGVPEVLGDNAIYLESETIAGLADAITRAKGVAASAQSTVNGAFLNDYTWTGTISRLKSLLQQIK